MSSTLATFKWTPETANLIEELVGFGILLAECERYEVAGDLLAKEIKKLQNSAFHAMVLLWGDDVAAEVVSDAIGKVLHGMLAQSAAPAP